MKTYTLITVTNSGKVHVQEGIQSKEMAEEAASMALYGRTIEEKKAHDKWLEEVYFPSLPKGACYTDMHCGSCKFAKVFCNET